MDPSPPITTFYRSFASAPVTFLEVTRDRTLNVEKLCELVVPLHPVIQDALQGNRRRMRDQPSKEKLPSFREGDFVLVARENFTAGEKLCIHWPGPR